MGGKEGYQQVGKRSKGAEPVGLRQAHSQSALRAAAGRFYKARNCISRGQTEVCPTIIPLHVHTHRVPCGQQYTPLPSTGSGNGGRWASTSSITDCPVGSHRERSPSGFDKLSHRAKGNGRIYKARNCIPRGQTKVCPTKALQTSRSLLTPQVALREDKLKIRAAKKPVYIMYNH